jgi:hypothetical protein
VNTLESFPTKKHTKYISPRSQILQKSEIKNQKFENDVFEGFQLAGVMEWETQEHHKQVNSCMSNFPT